MSTHEPKTFINKNDIKLDVLYKPKVSLGKVIKYSTNKAMLFWITASIFNSYFLVNYENNNDKFLIIALSMYLTQIIYNYIDLNDSNSLEKLQFYINNH